MSIAPIRKSGSPLPISEAAADWVLRQEAGTLSERDEEQFAAWLAADPAHVAAYEDAIWALDAATRHAGDAQIREMREAALSARRERPVRRWLWGVGGGAVAASVAAAWLLSGQPLLFKDRQVEPPSSQVAANPDQAIHETAIGERLAITLPDGSVATLDTNSRLRVAYTGQERGIYLLRGQALFEVAHGRPAPFRVHAAGQEIVAVGTLFNVRLQGNRVEVALVEGTVKVRPAGGARDASAVREMTMRAGDTLEASAADPVAVRSADVTRIIAWRGGELVFNDTRLDAAVAEINRYTRRPIQIDGAAVGAHRISGVFRTSDPERFSQAMSEVLPIEVTHRSDGGASLRERRD